MYFDSSCPQQLPNIVVMRIRRSFLALYREKSLKPLRATGRRAPSLFTQQLRPQSRKQGPR